MNLEILLLAFIVAFLVESFVEYIAGTPFDHASDKIKQFKWVLMYISMGSGVALAFYYKIDLVAYLTGNPTTPVGMVLSGLSLGRGAEWLHKFIGLFKKVPEDPPQMPPFEDTWVDKELKDRIR